MPELYDILLSNVDEEILHNEISKALGQPYLSETPALSEPIHNITGTVWGRNYRIFFPTVVTLPRSSSPSYIVHFLYDSGCPHVFLSHKTCDLLFGTNPIPHDFPVIINGLRTLRSRSNLGSHFEDVNILGGLCCAWLGLRVIIHYDTLQATIEYPPHPAPPTAPTTPTARKQLPVVIRAEGGQSSDRPVKGKGKDGN